MSEVIDVTPEPNAMDADLVDALAMIERLKEAIISRKIKAFVGVSLAEDHGTGLWLTATGKTTRLEIIGALSWLNHIYMAAKPEGEEGSEPVVQG